MSTWSHIAEWAEFKAEVMREEATKAEALVGTESAFAYAAALRLAAEVMEKNAKEWRFKSNMQVAREAHKRGTYKQ